MIYKLEMRWDIRDEWIETISGDGAEVSRWDNADDAYHAFIATVERWTTIAHRLVMCDDSGNPLAVVAVLDLGRIEEKL